MNPFSTNNRRHDLMIKVTRGRYNLLFLVLMSVVNIFLITSSSKMLLPYSSAISDYSVALGITEALKSGNSSFRILGLAIACAVLMILMVCYVLSKSKPLYFVIALSIFAADTIALAVLEGVNGALSSPYVILNLVIHLLSIFYLISSIKASKELMRLPAEEETNKFEPTPAAEENILEDDENVEETEPLDHDDNEEDDDDEDLSQPIGKYVDDGTKPLVQGEYAGLDVFAVIRDNKAELVINGFVCDELDVYDETEFLLRAFVNDIEFTFDYKETEIGTIMYLYADDELLDSLGLN